MPSQSIECCCLLFPSTHIQSAEGLTCARKPSQWLISVFSYHSSLDNSRLHINLVIQLVEKQEVRDPACFAQQKDAKHCPEAHHISRAYAKEHKCCIMWCMFFRGTWNFSVRRTIDGKRKPTESRVTNICIWIIERL